MSSEEQQFIEVFTTFIERFTQGVEAFQYKGKQVGTGIFLLNFIGKHPYCMMSDVKEFLKMIPSAATRRIDKLERLGLVERINDIQDRRLVKLILTDEGKELYQKFMLRRIHSIRMMKKEFNQDEINIFFKILKRFLELDPDIRKKTGMLET